MQILADGRVVAAINAAESAGDFEPVFTRMVIFVKQDGQWLIDQWDNLVHLHGHTWPASEVVGPPPPEILSGAARWAVRESRVAAVPVGCDVAPRKRTNWLR